MDGVNLKLFIMIVEQLNATYEILMHDDNRALVDPRTIFPLFLTLPLFSPFPSFYLLNSLLPVTLFFILFSASHPFLLSLYSFLLLNKF